MFQDQPQDHRTSQSGLALSAFTFSILAIGENATGEHEGSKASKWRRNVIKRIDGMPAGTIGLEASGAVSADDYHDVLEPALSEAADRGDLRLLYVLGDDVKMDAGALLQDAKTGIGIGIGKHSAWKRTAVATDVEWLRRSMQLFAWMVPGEFKLFDARELDEAKAWIAG